MKSLIAVLLFVGVTLGALSPAFGYRDLETGTFITRDPAGFVDGPNLYTYVSQNPWTKFDPTGLREAEGSSDAEERQMEVYRNSHRGESPGEYRASQEALADKTYETVVKPGAEIGGGFVPGIGEGQDAAVIADPNAPGWQKALAAGSLTLSAWSGGFLPNAGGFIRAFGGNVVEAGADSARVTQKASQQAAEAATASGGAADDFVPNVPVGRRTKIMSEADQSPHSPQHVNSPLQPVQNTPGTVNDIDYSGHAFDQMRNRGLVPSVVENALRTGTRTAGNTPGTTLVDDAVNKVKVVINQDGRVVTVE